MKRMVLEQSANKGVTSRCEWIRSECIDRKTGEAWETRRNFLPKKEKNSLLRVAGSSSPNFLFLEEQEHYMVPKVSLTKRSDTTKWMQ